MFRIVALFVIVKIREYFADLTFIGPFIVIYSYNKTNEMH